MKQKTHTDMNTEEKQPDTIACEQTDGQDAPTSDTGCATENPPAPDAAEIEAMLAEAEQRGYLRGRNESIETLMRRPAMMQPIASDREISAEPEEPMILRRQRISIWDR